MEGLKFHRVFLCYSKEACRRVPLHGLFLEFLQQAFPARGLSTWAYEEFVRRFAVLRYEPGLETEIHPDVVYAIGWSDLFLYLNVDGERLWTLPSLGRPGERGEVDPIVAALDRGVVLPTLRQIFADRGPPLKSETKVTTAQPCLEWVLEEPDGPKYTMVDHISEFSAYRGYSRDLDTAYMGCELRAAGSLTLGAENGPLALHALSAQSAAYLNNAPGCEDVAPGEQLGAPGVLFCVQNMRTTPRPEWVGGRPEVQPGSGGLCIAYPRNQRDFQMWLEAFLECLPRAIDNKYYL